MEEETRAQGHHHQRTIQEFQEPTDHDHLPGLELGNQPLHELHHGIIQQSAIDRTRKEEQTVDSKRLVPGELWELVSDSNGPKRKEQLRERQRG
jgi:hypothetical protein